MFHINHPHCCCYECSADRELAEPYSHPNWPCWDVECEEPACVAARPFWQAQWAIGEDELAARNFNELSWASVGTFDPSSPCDDEDLLPF